MKHSLKLGASLCALVIASPAFAIENPVSSNTAVGIGVGTARSASTSRSQATAIGGGNATATGGRGGTGVGIAGGGNATGGNVTINSAPIPAQTSQTITNQGTTTVRSAPSVFSPGLAAAGIESCLGSISGGGSWIGTGISFGGSINDPGCNARLNSRTLWSFGLKKAAVAILCQQADIYAAMPDVCAEYLPRVATAPVVYPVAAPAVVPAGYYYDDIRTYHGGPIMLTDGRTGQERQCNNYDAARQRCRAWDGVVSPQPRQVSRTAWGKKVAAVSPSVTVPNRTVLQVTETPGKQPPLWIQMIHPDWQSAAPAPEVKREIAHDESVRKCLSFCAAGNDVQR